MEFRVERQPDGVAFCVVEPPAHYGKYLEDNYYVRSGGSYVRTFSTDAPFIDQVADCYRANAREWFACMIDRVPTPWADALEAVDDRLEDSGIDWFITGSCALAARGLNVEPGGVDLIFRTRDMVWVREMFQRQTIQPICPCEGWVAEGYGVLFLHAPICVTFGTQPCLDQPIPSDSGPYAAAHLEEVLWRGRTLRIPPLALSRNINERRGRAERVRIIDEFLAQAR